MGAINQAKAKDKRIMTIYFAKEAIFCFNDSGKKTKAKKITISEMDLMILEMIDT